MSNILNLKAVKFFAIIVLALAVLATFGMVAVQQADAAYVHTVTLQQGSSGAQVMALQQALGITADGAFGPMTKAAVVMFQRNAGLGLVADGIVGAKTGAALAGVAVGGNFPAGCTSASGFSTVTGQPCTSGSNLPAGCTSTAGFSPTTGTKCDGSAGGGNTGGGSLEGGAGSITLSAKSTYTNEDVLEGDEDAKVMAFDVEADDGSDVEITSVKVELAQTVTTNSQRISNYIDTVSVWLGSEKVGEADASDFSESSDVYTKNITLDGAVVDAGEKAVFVIAVTALGSLDSGDINDDAFTVDVLSARFEDAEGVVTTETPTANALLKNFDFDSLSTSGDAELKLSEGADNPDDAVVEVSESGTTDVTVLEFKLKAQGSEMLIDAIELTGTSTGVDDTFADMISEVTLEQDGDELDSVSAYASGTTTGPLRFTDLDFTIDEDETVTFSVVVKVKAIAATSGSATAFDQGDSFLVSFDGTDNLDDTTYTDVEDSNGDTVAAGDRSGSVTGEAQTFYTKGVVVTSLVDCSPLSDCAQANLLSDTTANNGYGTFQIKFSVMAIGQDIYLDKTVAASSSTSSTASGSNRVLILKSDGTTDVFASGIVESDDSDADEQTNTFLITEGSTADFTLQVTSSANPDSYIRAVLYGLEYSTADDATATTGAGVYTSNMGVDGAYKTSSVNVTD